MKFARRMLLLFLLAGSALASSPPTDPPLLQAADQGDLEKVRQLLDSGVAVSTHSDNGLNALNWAAYSGHVDIARLLLERGIDVDSNKNTPGWSPLMNASNEGYIDVVELLLAKGARLDLASKDGWLALDFAAAKQHLDVVKALLAHGADGNASLLAMVGKGDIGGVSVLLAAGVSPDARDKDGETALYKAMAKHSFDIASVLLAHDADTNLYPTEASNMDTPLKWAAYFCDRIMVQALVAHGAKKSGHGDDAYDLARTGWTHDMKPCDSLVQDDLRP